MSIEQIINDKVGRKQVIAIAAIICLQDSPEFLVAVALFAIAVQAVTDWKRPRRKRG